MSKILKKFLCLMLAITLLATVVPMNLSLSASADVPSYDVVFDGEGNIISGADLNVFNIKLSQGGNVTFYYNVDSSSLYFPTWTEAGTVEGNQDDLIWYPATNGSWNVDGHYYNFCCTFNVSEHNNESGSYVTHVYTINYDYGKLCHICYSLNLAPTVERVTLVQDGTAGYWAYANVVSNGLYAIDRVQFPSWTSAHGQDDLNKTGWSTDSTYTGTKGSWTVDNQTYNYRYYVSVAAHNNEYGKYNTHVYAYNNGGFENCRGTELNFKFTLTINAGEGTYAGETSLTDVFESTVNIADPTAPNGYHFKQWNLSGNGTFNDGTYVYGAGDGTLTAEYEVHTFDQQVATEKYLASDATCIAKATYFYSCVCGEKGTETFESGDTLGHDWDAGEVTTNPTCTEKGVKTYTCKRTDCGETYTEPVDAKGHTTEKTSAVEPTCTEDGVKEYWYCSGCEKYFADEECASLIDDLDSWKTGDGKIDALGHDWNDGVWTWSKDCKTATITFICSRNSKHTETIDAEISSEITVAPTCSRKGTTTYTAVATFEGVEYKDTKKLQNINKTEHQDDNDDEFCDVCGASLGNLQFMCPLCEKSLKCWQGDSFLLTIHSFVHIIYGILLSFGWVD